MTSSGSIMVDKITRLTSATPRNFFRARAYAASALTDTCRTVPKNTTRIEFSRYCQTPISIHAKMKFSSEN